MVWSTLTNLYYEGHYEVTLNYSLLRNYLTPDTWKWFTPLSHHIILGAIPLKTKNHIQELKEKYNVGCVITMNESFEWKHNTLFGQKAVQPSDWQEHQIIQHICSTPDRNGLSITLIEDTVNRMRQFAEQFPEKNIYVHCKAGRGRSTTIVACYYLKFFEKEFHYDAQAVIDYLYSQRHVSLGHSQIQNIKDFAKQLQSAQ